MVNSEPSAPSPAALPTPSSPPEGLRVPDKVSIKWLIDHVPVSWWLWAIGGLVTIFVGGFQVARQPIVQQFISSSARTTIQPTELATEDIQGVDRSQQRQSDKQSKVKQPNTLPQAPEFTPTFLRIVFGRHDKPQEVEAHNIEWTWVKPITKKEVGGNDLYVCQPPQIFSFTEAQRESGSNCKYTATKSLVDEGTWIIFMVFNSPVSAKDIKIDAHDAEIPKWEVSSLTNKKAVVYFYGDLKNVVIDINVVN